MEESFIHYSGFDLAQVRAESAEELQDYSSTFIRAELISNFNNISKMIEKGFTFGDRTIGVTINLKKKMIDYDRLVRFSLRSGTESDKPEILRIALSSFPTDRRFHVKPELDQRIADIIIQDWTDKLSNLLVCVYKDHVIGFLDLKPVNENEVSIHLAAVEERYRAAGAALSLYAGAIVHAREMKYQKVVGRISSLNTPVMNLYAYLGATFSEPHDVFLKEGNV